MKRRSLLGQHWDNAGKAEPSTFWWQDSERIIERALLIAKDNTTARTRLVAGLRRRTGTPEKHELAVRMNILDRIDYERAKQPRPSLDKVFAVIAEDFDISDDAVRGIYNRRKKPIT